MLLITPKTSPAIFNMSDFEVTIVFMLMTAHTCILRVSTGSGSLTCEIRLFLLWVCVWLFFLRMCIFDWRIVALVSPNSWSEARQSRRWVIFICPCQIVNKIPCAWLSFLCLCKCIVCLHVTWANENQFSIWTGREFKVQSCTSTHKKQPQQKQPNLTHCPC